VGGRCEDCGTKVEGLNAQVHHIIPRNQGGMDDPENLRLLCHACKAQANKLLRQQPAQDPWARWLVALRKSAELSVAECAAAAKMSRYRWRRYEAGDDELGFGSFMSLKLAMMMAYECRREDAEKAHKRMVAVWDTVAKRIGNWRDARKENHSDGPMRQLLDDIAQARQEVDHE